MRRISSAIIAAMPTDDRDAPASADLPDPERVYRNYVAQCRRMGITPTPRDRARKLIQEWTESLAATARRTDPPTTH